MIENDVERIEKKVDLLFKIFVGLNISYTDPSNRKYFNKYMDELVLVYDLSAEKDVIDNYPTQDQIQNWTNSLNFELERLKLNYKDGNFLSNEQNIIKMRIKDLDNKLERLLELSKNKEKFEIKNTELHKHNLFNNLQEKLGITEDHDSYGYRRLISKKDNIKSNVQNLIEELHDFIDVKGGISN